MEDLAIIIDLCYALGGALVGGMIAQRLRQPTIIGYLLAGIAVGPYTPLGLGPERVNEMAELGILLLMFTVGLEYSFSSLARVRAVAIYGGILQIGLSIAFGFVLARLASFDPLSSLYFGALIALSSTVVLAKILAERGETDSTHGRIALGICLVQDLSLVPMMVILPALAGPLDGIHLKVGIAMIKALLVVATIYLLGTRLIPRLLNRVSATGSNELFLVAVVLLALGTAAAVSSAGMSLAIGAFLAGILIADSQFNHQSLASVIPLRDLFSMLFFVTMGMLIDPWFVLSNLPSVTVLVLAVMVGKFVIATLVVRLFAYHPRTAIYTGMSLLQIGEFSFLLATTGLQSGAVPRQMFSLIITVALLTIIFSPLAMQLAEPLYQQLHKVSFLRLLMGVRVMPEGESQSAPLSGHAVLLGYGTVGQRLSQVLTMRNIPQLVIDHDPRAVELARSRGLTAIYGDAANPHLLHEGNLRRARLLAVTFADPMATQLSVSAARKANSRLDVIAFAASRRSLELLRNSGTSEVVNPSIEVALELSRHALHRFGVTSIEALSIVNRLREQYRQEEAADDLEDLSHE